MLIQQLNFPFWKWRRYSGVEDEFALSKYWEPNMRPRWSILKKICRNYLIWYYKIRNNSLTTCFIEFLKCLCIALKKVTIFLSLKCKLEWHEISFYYIDHTQIDQKVFLLNASDTTAFFSTCINDVAQVSKCLKWEI